MCFLFRLCVFDRQRADGFEAFPGRQTRASAPGHFTDIGQDHPAQSAWASDSISSQLMSAQTAVSKAIQNCVILLVKSEDILGLLSFIDPSLYIGACNVVVLVIFAFLNSGRWSSVLSSTCLLVKLKLVYNHVI